jgi:hypothetical protein
LCTFSFCATFAAMVFTLFAFKSLYSGREKQCLCTVS